MKRKPILFDGVVIPPQIADAFAFRQCYFWSDVAKLHAGAFWTVKGMGRKRMLMVLHILEAKDLATQKWTCLKEIYPTA